MRKIIWTTTAGLLLAGALNGCSNPTDGAAQHPAAGVAEPAATPAPAQRRALFGDLHLHTGWSFDAWGMSGVQTTPFDAYRFASGRKTEYMGRTVQKKRPLDFVAVTDHSEYLEVLSELNDPDSAFSHSEFAERYAAHPFAAFNAIHEAFTLGKPLPPYDYASLMRSAWRRTIEAANQYYHPGKFTTLIGYEWTAMPGGIYNLHRNVIFGGADAPLPFDSSLSQKPEDLWSYMEAARRQGYRLLAIPHNSNASGGFMFDWVDSRGDAIGRAYAERRRRNEPLVEVFQGKGQSEAIPSIAPNDEFADFEVLETLLTSGEISKPAGSYVRDALGRGLVLEQRTGVNPFALGFVGGTDFHNGLSTSAERDFAGRNFGVDMDSGMVSRAAAAALLRPRDLKSDSAQRIGSNSPSALALDPTVVGSGGLAGVWAEENTRAAIFSALERKETFATSGTRMRIRLFAGWNYADELLARPDWIERAYADGVPMGSDLGAAAGADKTTAPRLVAWAAKDPEGANLDRLQIVKLWLDGDEYREKIYDVAWSDRRVADPKTGKIPAVGNSVDLRTATYANTIGAPQLAVVWRDPDFDPAVAAVYYARAIEIPTPRWTTLLARHFDLPLPDNGRPTLQERAVSSPIWFHGQ